MNIDAIDENEEGGGQNPNEMNFYDANDTFIDDEDVCSDNSENEFTKISLPYENYTEEEIINNLLKADKIREKEDSRRKKKEVLRRKKRDENKENNIINKVSDKKTDDMQIDHVSPNNQKGDNNQNKQFSEIDSELEKIKSTFSLENVQKDLKDKMMFLKKISVFYRKINGLINIEYFLQKISLLFNASCELLQLILEFDKLKSKRDGIYSTIAKLILKLETQITETGINDISDCVIFKSNEKIRDILDKILERILNYLKINESVSIFLKTEENELKIKQFLETHILGDMSDSEAKAKIIHKFINTFGNASIVFNLENFTQIINTYIKEQEQSSIENKFMFDMNLRFIGEEGMLIDDQEEVGGKIAKPKKEKNKKNKPKNEIKNNLKNSKEENDNSRINSQENDSNEISVKRKKSSKIDEEKIKANEIIDLENSNTDMNMVLKEPNLSKRYYKVM
jgi:hypothetical protein